MWKSEKVKILRGMERGYQDCGHFCDPATTWNHWSGGVGLASYLWLLIDGSFHSLSAAITGSMLSLIVSSEQLILRSINESPRRIPESNLLVM